MIKLQDAKDQVRYAVTRKVWASINCAAQEGEENVQVNFNNENIYIEGMVHTLKREGYRVSLTTTPEGCCLNINWI